MSDNTPAIILVRPQMGENIGAAARAMLNFGLTDLRLVAPRDGWPNQKAIDNASGAMDVLPEPKIFDDLAASLADCHFSYATTARRRDMVKPVFTPEKATKDAQSRQTTEQKVAFVFGPERTGLENDELSLCQAIIHVPTNPDFSSLNLAQCVLLICYQWLNTKNDGVFNENQDLPAPQSEFESFFQRLEDELNTQGFFREQDLKPSMIRNIRNMFVRAEFTDQELRTFHGMISALIGNKTGNKKAANGD